MGRNASPQILAELVKIDRKYEELSAISIKIFRLNRISILEYQSNGDAVLSVNPDYVKNYQDSLAELNAKKQAVKCDIRNIVEKRLTTPQMEITRLNWRETLSNSRLPTYYHVVLLGS